MHFSRTPLRGVILATVLHVIGLVASSTDARSFVGTEGFIPPEGASWLYEVKMIGGFATVVVAARMNFQYALGRRK